jgi:hypothetical protein
MNDLDRYIEWLNGDITIPIYWGLIIHISFVILVMKILHNILTYIDEKIINKEE